MKGLDGFQAELMSPQLTTGRGPGAYDALLLALRELGGDPNVLATLETAWRDRSFPGRFARPLLILAAIRYRALTSEGYLLAPEALADAVAPELQDRLRDAFMDPALAELLATRTLRSRDPGRGLGWGLIATALRLPNRGFALVQFDAGAGLELVVDLTTTSFRMGAEQAMGLDFPTPHHRVGLDAAPLDVCDDAVVNWLQACIWPGQPQRLERLTNCMEILRRPWRGASPAPSVEAVPLGSDAGVERLNAVTADPAVEATLVFETGLRGNALPADQRRHDTQMATWLAGGRPRVRIQLEPAPPGPSGSAGGPMSLVCSLFRDDAVQTFEVARTAYHPDACVIVPGALSTLRQWWIS